MKATLFQQMIEKEFGFSVCDQATCTLEVIERVEKMGLPVKDCIINTVFVDEKEDALYHQRVYCLQNCGFKCLRNFEYKSIKGEKK